MSSFKIPEIKIARHSAQQGQDDDIDFEIKGQEMQFVEIELDPGESAIAEAGAMMMKNSHITMYIVFCYCLYNDQSGCLFDKLLGAGKR
ncbi:MAG: AIM24 family protein, partial [Rhizobiales bacterium]|nr:AIM24 family protein [Hyphomicrobiales bacterium]